MQRRDRGHQPGQEPADDQAPLQRRGVCRQGRVHLGDPPGHLGQRPVLPVQPVVEPIGEGRQQPGELPGQPLDLLPRRLVLRPVLDDPIEPVAGSKLSPISTWLRQFAVEWGNFLDTEASRRYLESFKYAPEYNWQDYEKPPEAYASFNEFFARTFKDIEVQRPVAARHDDRVIVFPADSTFVGQWAVSTPVGEPFMMDWVTIRWRQVAGMPSLSSVTRTVWCTMGR